MLQRFDRGKKARTRGDAVVDQYDTPVLHRRRSVVAAVGMPSAFEFCAFACDGLCEIRGRQAFVCEYIVVPRGNTAARQGKHEWFAHRLVCKIGSELLGE